MSLSNLAALNLVAPRTERAAAPRGTRDERALRQAATEFEALLLKQLTAALSPSEDDEDSLFGHGTGDSMYQQMFGEQLALAMARDGGVGLAETILQQMRGSYGNTPDKSPALNSHEAGGAERAFAAARAVRRLAPASAANTGAAEASVAPAAADQPTVLTAAAKPPALAAPILLPAASTAPLAKEAVVAAVPTAVSPTPSVLPTTTRAPLPTTLPAVKATSAASATPVPAPAAVALHLPLRGRISSQFGVRHDPLHGGERQHHGVDIAAARGTPIAAAADGKVVFAGRRGGYGNLVEIEHPDGRRTRYAHAQEILVKPGDQVERGQTVATVGSTGRSTGPHVHFEVREQGTTINPLAAVAKDSSTKHR